MFFERTFLINFNPLVPELFHDLPSK